MPLSVKKERLLLKRNDLCWCGSGLKYKKCHLQQDREKGSGLRRKHIKSKEEIEGMRKAGSFNGMLMDYIREFVEPGVSTGKLDKLIYEFTLDHGHRPAPLGYRGFPKSSCISKNNVVCHGIPSEDEYLEDGDIVNIDLTTIVNGYHGDSSETFLIGDVSSEAGRLVKVAAEALLRGIEAVKPQVTMGVIGDAVQSWTEKNGCSVVRDYTGHGIGREFHENFTVYHHRMPKDKNTVMYPGMTFTIEPMINLGEYGVETDKKDKWTVRTRDRSLSAQFEHTLLVTNQGCEILTLTPSEIKEGITLKIPEVVKKDV